MKMHDKCLPCVVNQAIKVADLTGIENKEPLLREVFAYLSCMDFNTTTPEIIGDVFEQIKRYTNNQDPYKETRQFYNAMFLEHVPIFEERIDRSNNPLLEAIRYAVVGNMIDFNPIHATVIEDIEGYFEHINEMTMAFDDSQQLMKDILKGKNLLYLGDNCGEICLDKILMKKIKALNPAMHIQFAVRGKPVVNDSIVEDAYDVGIDEIAEVIDNGDGSLGTVLHRTSDGFRKHYEQADIIIAKGQANYECLSEEKKNIYFMLMTKCDVIANDIGAPRMQMVCKKGIEPHRLR